MVYDLLSTRRSSNTRMGGGVEMLGLEAGRTGTGPTVPALQSSVLGGDGHIAA